MLSHKNNESEFNISFVEDGILLTDRDKIMDVFDTHFLSEVRSLGTAEDINSTCTLTDIIERHVPHDSVDR